MPQPIEQVKLHPWWSRPLPPVFTWLAVILLIGTALLVISPPLIVGPGTAREAARRAKCLANLRGFGSVLRIYASGFNDEYPAVLRGPKDEVDTQAAMWLLATTCYASPGAFVCPTDHGAKEFEDMMTYTDLRGESVTREPFPMVDDNGQVPGSGAPAATNRSISYAFQIANADMARPGKDNPKATRFAIMADRGPPIDQVKLLPVTAALPATTSGSTPADLVAEAEAWLETLPMIDRMHVNSPIHGGAGQNVLFQDGHAAWSKSPWCGIDDDNIYTWAEASAGEVGRVRGQVPDATRPITRGPTSDDDSVLANITAGQAETLEFGPLIPAAAREDRWPAARFAMAVVLFLGVLVIGVVTWLSIRRIRNQAGRAE